MAETTYPAPPPSAPERTADPLEGLVTFVRACFAVAGAVALLPVLATLVLRQVPLTSPMLVAYVAGTPVVVLAGLGSIVLLLVAGSRVGVAVATVLTVLLVLTQAPLYLGTGAAADDATPLTVMTINMHFGGADADAIVAAVREHDVDVLATQEMTRAAVERLHIAGIDDILPFGVTNDGYGAAGNGIWSRYALTAGEPPPGLENPPVVVTLHLDGRTVSFATVHPVSPYPDDTVQWSHELGLLAAWLGAVDGLGVVAGDFNSTQDHEQFRDVLAGGYDDAAAQVGAGWLPTYPIGRRRIPELITIDHVLSRGGIVATHVERLEIIGTDHATLVVELAVPRRTT